MSPGVVAETDLKGNLQSEYVFFDGERVARRDFPSGAVLYYFSDHLKTTSVIVDSAGNIKSDSDFLPFGAELQFLNGDPNHYKFGGHEHDNETGNDYFGAREYSSPLSRFLTPDWAGKPITVPYADFGNPQSLNLYSYTKNNPTTFGDLDGHDGGGATDPEIGNHSSSALPGGPCFANGRCIIEGGQNNGANVRIGPFSFNPSQAWEGFKNSAISAIGGLLGIASGGQVGLKSGAEETLKPRNLDQLFGASAFAAASMLIPGGEEEGLIEPGLVRFSQKSVRGTFEGGGTISELAAGLKNGTIDPASIPAIRLVKKNGKLYTLDNRRLAAFQQAGVAVPYRIATPEEAARESWKFTTKNDGVSIRIRGQN